MRGLRKMLLVTTTARLPRPASVFEPRNDAMILPISAVVPTKDRAHVLERTLASLAEQDIIPAELIVVDGSAGSESRMVIQDWAAKLASQNTVRWLRAEKLGAAVQRNQGLMSATQPFIWFFDDDILFEPDCVPRLWRTIEGDPRLGGVSAMITNQKYHPPGLVSRTVFALIHGRNEATFAGRVIGPAVNLLPEDREDLPETVPTEWLNLGCTIYRREALPNPVFDSVFTGYSLMEDLTLSVRVGKKWRLANARKARIYHDSQPGAHKADVAALAEMELVNRHYVMTEVLDRRHWMDYARLFIWEFFQLLGDLRYAKNFRRLSSKWGGKWRAAKKIYSAISYSR